MDPCTELDKSCKRFNDMDDTATAAKDTIDIQENDINDPAGKDAHDGS